MDEITRDNTRPAPECRSMKVEDCAKILGIGRGAMYDMARAAEQNHGNPFVVLRTKGKLLVSKKSFNAYLDSIGF